MSILLASETPEDPMATWARAVKEGWARLKAAEDEAEVAATDLHFLLDNPPLS